MAGKAGRRGFGRTRKLPSGRWQAFYTDPDGRVTLSKTGKPTPVRHTAPKTFLTREDAEGWLTDERRMISLGTWAPPLERLATKIAMPITFGEYSETWLKTRKVKGQPLADRTRDGYRDLLDRFILQVRTTDKAGRVTETAAFKDVALIHIDSDMVDHWYETTAVDTPTYQARAYSLLRTILGTAVDRGLIKTANPAKVRGAGNVKRRHQVETASLEELAVIAANMPAKRRMMIQLDAWCSLRFGEITELRRNDIAISKVKVIDPETGAEKIKTRMVIKIRRGVIRTKSENDAGEIETVRKVKTPKTDAGVRDVEVPPHLHGDMAEHLLEHCAPGRDGLLFYGGTQTTHLSPSTFYGRESTFFTSGPRKGEIKRKGHGYYEARRLAGRPDLHFHDLRHTGLTNAAIAGATLAELMAMAGHTTPGAVMIYQHAANERMQDLATKLSKMAGFEADA
jgi:integrase